MSICGILLLNTANKIKEKNSIILSYFFFFYYHIYSAFLFGLFLLLLLDFLLVGILLKELLTDRRYYKILYDRHYKLCRVQLIYCVQRKQFSKNNFCSSLVFTYIWNLLLSLLKTTFLSKKDFLFLVVCLLLLCIEKKGERIFSTLFKKINFFFSRKRPLFYFLLNIKIHYVYALV